MSNHLATRIRKNHWGGINPKPTSLTTRPKYIIGFDSEADTSSNGKPMLFQFSLPNTSEDDTLTVVVPDKQHAGVRVLLNFLDAYCYDSDVEYLIYAWNTQYELTQLFHDLPSSVLSESEFEIEKITDSSTGNLYDWSISVANQQRQIVTFTKNKANRKRVVKVAFLDGTAFYKTSLDSAAKMLGLGEKYASDTIHRELFTRGDLANEEFLRYARRDAYITRRIGEYIQLQHEQQGIATCISAPHFAATVFRTNFLTNTSAKLSPDIEQAGLYSYHGGKNGFYLSGPAEYGSIYQYDITSAYPEAMWQLPDIEASGWQQIREYIPGVHALYQITAQYNRCTYRGMQNHDGSWAESGIVDGVWITSYELDAMVERREIVDFLSISGWQLIGPRGGALTNYVDTFFHIKKTTTGPERETAKLMLNSLYGKFFQKQPLGTVGHYDLNLQQWIETDPNSDWDYVAGGLYNPPIASLITGFVRAKIHRLEHKYEAVMTSTDGFFANNPPDASDIGTDLGLLTVSKGRLRIWRERLYIFDGNDGKRKFALHGYRSNVNDLEDIPLARGEYNYFGKQMITIKMSTRESRGNRYSPGEFVTLLFVLQI